MKARDWTMRVAKVEKHRILSVDVKPPPQPAKPGGAGPEPGSEPGPEPERGPDWRGGAEVG